MAGKNGGVRPGSGRKPGSLAKHTIQAQEAKKKLIEMYSLASEQITLVLIQKALAGDILAIRELHDRTYGKSYQPGDVDVTSGGKPIQLDDAQYKQAIAAAVKRSSSDQSSA